MFDSKKSPKTFRGQVRKGMTGDGRKNLDTDIREALVGKRK
jgi:hypothetical protein